MSTEIDIRKELSNYVIKSRYTKYLPKLKRRENWVEACDRLQNMHLQTYSFLSKKDKDLIKWAFSFVKDKKVGPSMRSLQFGGDAILAHQSRMYNCCVRHIDSLRAFSEVMYLLLCGCGVGFGLSKKFIGRLPHLVGPKDKTGTVVVYVVEDTIEGWADSIQAILSCYVKNNPYSGRKIVFDYSKIRAKGTPLKTGGGKAPGHEPLKLAHQKIKYLLDYIIEKEGTKKLRPIHVYDILMYCADAVISGGIRRAATIAIFDEDDIEMIEAKTLVCVDNYQVFNEFTRKSKFDSSQEETIYQVAVDYKGRTERLDLTQFEFEQINRSKQVFWSHLEKQRARSNNSILFLRSSLTLEKIQKAIERTKSWGEPGFVFAEHEDTLYNPCVEISFISVTKDGICGVQMCVAGDTKLITKNHGLVDIQKVVGENIEIWNGKNWSTVKPFQTGINQDLYRVYFGDGSFLDVTSNHRFLVKRAYHTKYTEFTTLELIEKINSRDRWSVPRTDIIWEGGEKLEHAYEYGFFAGDGHMDHGVPKICLFKDELQIKLDADFYDKDYFNSLGTKFKTGKFSKLDITKCKSLKEFELPSWVGTLNQDSFLEFIAGWVDADGSQANNGCRLYGKEKMLRSAQLLLTRCGVHSSINICQLKGTITNVGERTYDLYYLQIPDASKIPSRRLHLANGKLPKFKGKTQTINKIVKLEGKHSSFCLTENELNCCVFNNVLTKQCNLTTINGTKVKDIKQFKEYVEAATIIGTLQAGYTDFNYLSPASKELTEDEALLGVSITGILDSPEFFLNPDNLVVGANHAVQVNKIWAKKIGIKQAARVTCVKPEGSTTLVFESFGSGANPSHGGPKHLRRVQVNKIENVYKYFKKHNEHATEESVWSASNSDDVISFPLTVPEGVMTKDDLTALKHLEYVKLIQQNWVNPGTTTANKKPLTHSVSCTIVVDNDEWDDVAKYLLENKDYFSAVSFLAKTGDKDFIQAPNEKMITDEDMKKFDSLVENWKSVDYDLLFEEEDETQAKDSVACGGGACEINI